MAAVGLTVASCRRPHVHTFLLRACGPRASFRESFVKISAVKSLCCERRITYNFPIKQIVFPFPTISFEPRTHIHTGPHHGDSLVETLRDQRVVHLAFRNGFLPLHLSGPNELEESTRTSYARCFFSFAGLTRIKLQNWGLTS